MAIEIERKFLVRNENWRAQAVRAERMAQAYLNDAAALREARQNVSVRVRISGERAWLNLKSRELGISRQEFEYAIAVADADALLALCVGARIEKRRHYVECGEHLWEVDEFLGDNVGLVVAEIELSSESESFQQPEWLGLEVTDHVRYFNVSLAERPYSRWTEGEKQPCS